MVKELPVTELNARLKKGDDNIVVIDVREPWEVSTASIAGTLNIPMNSVPSRLDDIPEEKEIAVLCHHGARSRRIAEFLSHNGFKNVYNITGGIAAWSRDVDPAVPNY